MVQLQPVGVGDVLVAAGITLEVLAARHSVPAVGYAARGRGRLVGFSGDTQGGEPAFWRRVNALQAEAPGVGALVIETAFSNAEQALARKSAHLAPVDLARELAQLESPARFPVYLTHLKPSEGGAILREVRALQQGGPQIVDLQTVDSLQV